MTPDQSLDQHRRSIGSIGEQFVVRRWSGPDNARVPIEAVAMGRPFGLKSEQIVGGIKAGDVKVILLNDPAAVVPDGKVALSTLLPLTTNDKLVLGGQELSIRLKPDDKTRRIAGVVIALEIIAGG